MWSSWSHPCVFSIGFCQCDCIGGVFLSLNIYIYISLEAHSKMLCYIPLESLETSWEKGFLKGGCGDQRMLLRGGSIWRQSCFPLSWVCLIRGQASKGRRNKKLHRQVERNSSWADVGAGSCMICHERAGSNRAKTCPGELGHIWGGPSCLSCLSLQSQEVQVKTIQEGKWASPAFGLPYARV